MGLAAFNLIFYMTFTGTLIASPGAAYELKSPDGNVAFRFEVREGGRLCYNLSYRGKQVLNDSRLGFALEGGDDLDGGFKITQKEESLHDAVWEPVYGERSVIRDHYHRLVLQLEDGRKPPRRMQLIFRAYNEGAAFCYSFPDQEGLSGFTITEEYTEFNFARDYNCYPVYSAQGIYEKSVLSRVKPGCERPLTVELEGDTFAAVAEARLVDFARMRLKPAASGEPVLQSMLAGPVKVNVPCTTPWRVILLGDSPGQLLERNYLILNLNEPCAIEDTSWIKPGKVIREVTLTTEGGKRCVDFAVERGIRYVEYDAGWYGHEYDEASDATTVTRDPGKSGVQGELDLHEVIRYARERDIGILVYVNRRQLERQLDEILPLYRQWGIQGVKYGFVQVGSQRWTVWLHEAVRKAAGHRLMVDIHDEYRPTGYSRTYPNLMTQEGVHGNECMPPAENNLVLPFTRFLCGAADCTICWYCDRVKNTRAHQLATAVVFYSPWQFVHWYDRPEQYRGEPELDFLKHVPVVWDETRVIHGRIGEYITMARRRGSDWYLGSLNAIERRKLEIPLDFLEPGKQYNATLYSDARPEGGSLTAVNIRTITAGASTILEADLAANGGQAVRIVQRNHRGP